MIRKVMLSQISGIRNRPTAHVIIASLIVTLPANHSLISHLLIFLYNEVQDGNVESSSLFLS